MDATPNLDLPYIMAAQAQKHVTHNEAIRKLDALVQLSIIDRDATVPPADPTDGDRYIVASGATGAWMGHDLEIAAFQDGTWAFYAASEGWHAWLADENTLVAWNGAAWIGASGITSINPTPLIGINTAANSSNRLAVKSDTVLLSHDDVTPGTGNQRTVLNKAATAKTASVVLQSNWSGRAEVGLAGNDDLAFKVSADGASFATVLTLKSTGQISFTAANPNSSPAVLFNKARSATTSFRFAFEDVGGFSTDGGGGAAWRGVHMGGPAGGITYSSVLTFPRVIQYLEYDSNTDPTFSRFVWDIANSGGNTHDIIFRVNGNVDQLRLTATAADFRNSIVPRADNTISLGTSGKRFSEVWAANGTIQTSDARDKEVIDRLDPAKAVAAVDTIEPVFFRWNVGGYDVIGDWQHTVVPPDAGEDYDYDAAAPQGETRTVPRAGQRIHAGFLAQDVKAALDAQELDFGVWGLENKTDPESRQWLRPDQLIPLLWAALRETRAEVAALKRMNTIDTNGLP
ncbi:MAG: DUF2793 domain-containing protein [Hyphomicrobiaceae bacterium]